MAETATCVDVPVTAPTPGAMDSDVAPVTFQLSITLPAALRNADEGVKRLMTGTAGAATVTVIATWDDTVGSATAIALTWNVPAAVGAV